MVLSGTNGGEGLTAPLLTPSLLIGSGGEGMTVGCLTLPVDCIRLSSIVALYVYDEGGSMFVWSVFTGPGVLSSWSKDERSRVLLLLVIDGVGILLIIVVRFELTGEVVGVKCMEDLLEGDAGFTEDLLDTDIEVILVVILGITEDMLDGFTEILLETIVGFTDDLLETIVEFTEDILETIVGFTEDMLDGFTEILLETIVGFTDDLLETIVEFIEDILETIVGFTEDIVDVSVGFTENLPEADTLEIVSVGPKDGRE